MKTKLIRLFVALTWLALPALVQAQFLFRTNNGAITITGYYSNGPREVVIPATINGYPVTTIGDSAFVYSVGVTSVTIPDSVTSIGEFAFGDCTDLTSVNIGNGVTNIGAVAFANCPSLNSVTIPNSVTSIGIGPFAACPTLTSITVDVSNPAYGSDNGVLFDKSQATLLQFPGGLSGDYTIPGSVTNIGGSAFYGCNSLTSVTIGTNVIRIGDYAFALCSSLTALIVDAQNPVYTSVSGVLFDKSQATLLQFPGALAGSYTIPGSVTSIAISAFADCYNLTSVTIPNSVTSIGQYAFDNCTKLTSVYFTGNAPSPTNDSSVFTDYPYSDPATVYYLPGTTGWGAVFDGLPTAPWFLPNPLILNNGPGFGVQPGGFGFTISWATNASVVVEAATNLANPVWIPVSTNTLTGGTNHFSDPQWTNYPGRFYRVRISH